MDEEFNAGMEAQAYRARRPKLSLLWECLGAHFDTFLDIYPEANEHDYGLLRPIIEITFSSIKLGAKAPEGRKAISYQPLQIFR
ncbi:MAG: hypothetical protein Fur0032_11480 [Terrimicrobiaceae bacterium]